MSKFNVDSVHDDVIEWRHHLHQHPELSNREVETEKFIVEKLKDFGYKDITDGVAGHGVVAHLEGKGRGKGKKKYSILLRADIDALPVKDKSGVDFASEVVDKDYPGGPFPVSHACGHDCHTAMLLGAAKLIIEDQDNYPGDVTLVFQPAEEGPPVDEDGGASVMIKEDVVSKLDPTLAFGMHVTPAPKSWIAYSTNVQHAASELVKITVTGNGVHGSTPWAGTDPMPPAADIIAAMGQVYRQIDSHEVFTITIGHIEDTGRFNIVGDEVTLWGTVRCLDADTTKQINDRITTLVENISAGYGAKGEVEFLQQIPPVVNAPELMEELRPIYEEVGKKVVEIPAQLGYDDVSEFIDAFGGAYALLGVQDVTMNDKGKPVPEKGGRGIVPNHNPGFYADDESLLTGVELHLAVARAHLNGELTGSEQ